jgi:DNA repair protein RecN (Recombination protein N)
MLQRLAIRNYALIDTLDIDFSKELNILTGETGAGKSIILGALSLLLGQRAESKYFFNQEKKCVIEGAFKIDDYHLKQFFEEQDLDYEAETVLRREISLDGKTRAFINDTPVTVAILKQVGEQLIDIHSQHATLAINTESFQLLVLDTLCNHASLLAEYQQALGQHKQLTKKLKELELALSEAISAQEYIQYQFEELEKAGLEVNEQEDLEHELKSLTHAEEIKRNLSAALFLLSNGEQTSIAQLKEVVQLSKAIEKYATGIQPLIERLQSSLIELKDIAAELERLAQGTSINEARTNMISERLDILYTLQKKHRVSTVSDLLVLRDQFAAQLQQLVSGEEEITRLQQEERVLKSNLVALAQQLTTNRKQVIPALEQQVQKALTMVGMPHAQLRVSQETDINQLNLTGADRIQFLFSANKGQAPMPMNKVASGGELSRLMLCIKSLIAKKTALPTIIFDEIDTGISGEIALKVGAIMEQMAQSMQVITITHLPQIASKKGKHFRVFKNDAGEQTSTGIEALHKDERILEVAKMLGGEQASAAAMEHAKELLSN